MQLACTVKKSFHFKREIADSKILHFDLGAKARGVSAMGPTSLESSFDADVKVLFTWYATKHSFCDIHDLLAVLEHQKSTRPPSHADAQDSNIVGAIPPKLGENLCEM